MQGPSFGTSTEPLVALMPSEEDAAYETQVARKAHDLQAQQDLADAQAQEVKRQASNAAAMAQAYKDFGGGPGAKVYWKNPDTGDVGLLPDSYAPPTAADVAQRVLPASASSAVVTDIAKGQGSNPASAAGAYTPPPPKGTWMAAHKGPSEGAPSASGAIHWSVGGKWYERAPGSSVDVPVKAPVTTFEAITGAKPMSSETMDAIRHGIRAQGAFGGTPLDKGQAPEEFNAGYFGTKLPEVAAGEPLSAGGVSTSSQPAFLPPSMIENAGTRLTMAQIANAKRELEPADLTVPEGSVSPRESLALEMAKRSGATKGQAMGIASELANRAAHQPNPNPNSVEQQDQRYLRLTQAQAAHDKAVQQINNDTRLTAPQKADQIAKVTAALSLAKQNYRLGKGDMLADILAETQAPTK